MVVGWWVGWWAGWLWFVGGGWLVDRWWLLADVSCMGGVGEIIAF